ncbi:hypothetical protein [Flammeovirga pacifica]|uniref:Uncharacterized protein n=1 Tax=Flammeovirga pacifica TaxID=915059 RepID=A0A1S1YU76_FLAPC|nr:hypothetical protein [Flammeovirga pacifica]OHX64582.1 hypothetical protein NH26_23710 [Flammeovirga pacifica]
MFKYEGIFGERMMALGEELFHQYQYDFYGLTQEQMILGTSTRSGAERESEAKVFDMLLLNTSGKELIPIPDYMIDLAIQNDNDEKGSLYYLLNFHEGDKSIKKGGKYWNSYDKYLKSLHCSKYQAVGVTSNSPIV